MDECFTECSNAAVSCIIDCDGNNECVSTCNRDKHSCDNGNERRMTLV